MNLGKYTFIFLWFHFQLYRKNISFPILLKNILKFGCMVELGLSLDSGCDFTIFILTINERVLDAQT